MSDSSEAEIRLHENARPVREAERLPPHERRRLLRSGGHKPRRVSSPTATKETGRAPRRVCGAPGPVLMGRLLGVVPGGLGEPERARQVAHPLGASPAEPVDVAGTGRAQLFTPATVVSQAATFAGSPVTSTMGV